MWFLYAGFDDFICVWVRAYVFKNCVRSLVSDGILSILDLLLDYMLHNILFFGWIMLI